MFSIDPKAAYKEAIRPMFGKITMYTPGCESKKATVKFNRTAANVPWEERWSAPPARLVLSPPCQGLGLRLRS